MPPPPNNKSPFGGNPGPSRPPPPIDQGAQEAQRKFIQEFRVSPRVKVKVTLFRTNLSKFTDSLDFVTEQITNAKDVLNSHNLELDVFPANGTPTNLPFAEGIIDDVQIAEVRKQAQAAGNVTGRFPIIFCPFHDNYREVKDGGDKILGEKYGGPGKPVNGVEGPAFAIINVRKKAKSGMTLLHEMGHGAGLGHWEGAGDKSNFMFITDTDGPGERRGMLCCQVAALAASYFADPQTQPSPDFKKRCPRDITCRAAFPNW